MGIGGGLGPHRGELLDRSLVLLEFLGGAPVPFLRVGDLVEPRQEGIAALLGALSLTVSLCHVQTD